MAWKMMFLEALDAPRNGETAREAQRRAMYARPDALPLPDDGPAKQSGGWLARILAGPRRERAQTADRSMSGARSK